MYNFTELLISFVDIRQNDRIYACQVNFSVAVHISRQFLSGDIPPTGIESLIAKFISPIRPGRSVPRIQIAKTFVSFSYRMS